MLVRLAVLTGSVIALGVGVPQFAPQLAHLIFDEEPATHEVSVVAPERAPAIGAPERAPAIVVPESKPVAAAPKRHRNPKGRSETITADRQGHFQVTASVGGRQVDLMVDTGATAVAINEKTARRLGIHPTRQAYRHPISTANGVIHAAEVTLPSVRIGRITLTRVRAVVVPGEALPVNLLGMSFLNRLRSFEVAGDRLVMEL